MRGPLLQLTLVSLAVTRRAMGALLRKHRVAEESQLPTDQQGVSDRSIGHGAPAIESGFNPESEVSRVSAREFLAAHEPVLSAAGALDSMGDSSSRMTLR